MLVLNRRIGETIRVDTSDGPITIMVTDVVGCHSRIGIEAPPEVKIRRGELLEPDAVKQCVREQRANHR
jgi:carbon storage regulator CsrA